MGALKTLATAIHLDIEGSFGLTWGGFTWGESEASTYGVQLKVGAEHLDEHAAPPRIVWVHERVTHDRRAQAGPKYLADGSVESPFLRRTLRCSVHVWGRDSDEAETLVEALLAATYRVMGTRAARFGGEDWPQQRRHQRLEHGENVIVHLDLAHPVAARRWTTVTIESQRFTFDMVESIE